MLKLFVTMFAFASLAQAGTLPEETVGLYKLMDPTVSVSNYRCPKGKVCASSQTSVKLNYTLSGCLDVMAPLSFTVDRTTAGIVIYASAYGYQNKGSENVKCFRAPVGTAEIVLPGVIEPSEIRVFDLDKESNAETN